MKLQNTSLANTLRVIACIAAAWVFLFMYIDKQNQLTSLRRHIPDLMVALQNLQEDNTELEYEIDQFESPLHLMELMRKPEFSHLKPAFDNEVMTIKMDAAHTENL